MKRSMFSEKQITTILKEQEARMPHHQRHLNLRRKLHHERRR